MLYPMIIVHSPTKNIFLFRYSLFYQFVLYMYYMYKIFIIFLLAENNFKDNLYYYYINCLHSMSWKFPKITMDVVTLSHILISIVNMHMCLMACELISLNTRKVVCNNIDLLICCKCKRLYVLIFRLSPISIKLTKLRKQHNLKVIFKRITLIISIIHKITNDIFSYYLQENTIFQPGLTIISESCGLCFTCAIILIWNAHILYARCPIRVFLITIVIGAIIVAKIFYMSI